MSDTFGALQIPVAYGATDIPVGDPALFYIGDYLKTLINAKAQTAWLAAKLGPPGIPVVRSVYYVSPNGFVLDDCSLPALFVYRPSGRAQQETSDFLEDESLIKVAWMLPHDRCRELDPRRVFFNAIAKIVTKYIYKVRDPLWSYSTDPEPGAITVAADTDSIVLSVATAVAPAALSGGGLTGIRAGTTMTPRLAPTVTTSITVADCYNTSDPIVWTCINWHGDTVTKSLTLTAVRGGETLTVPEDVRRVVSIAVPAQISALGFFQFGTALRPGRGSNLLDATNMTTLRATGWRALNIKVEELNASGQTERSETFEAVEIDLVGSEMEEIDTSIYPVLATSPAGVTLDTYKDDLLLASRELP